MTVDLTLECVVLVALAVGWHLAEALVGGEVYPLIAMAALAMGVQSVAVRWLGVSGVATTYITGTLTTMTSRLVQRLRSKVFTTTSAIRDAERPRQETPSARDLAEPATVWFTYGVGAVAGGAAELQRQPPAVTLLLHIAVVVAVVVTAAVRCRHH